MWGRWVRLLVLAVLTASSPANAVQLVASSGTLQSCGAGTCLVGCSRDGLTTGVGGTTAKGCTGAGCTGSCLGTSLTYDWVQPDGASVLIIQPQAAFGTTGTITIEESIDNGTTWAPVANFAITIGTNDVPPPAIITSPGGRYRSDLTATAGGGFLFAVKYKFVRLTNQ